MDRRFIIFIILSVVIIYGWQFIYKGDKPKVGQDKPLIEQSEQKVEEKPLEIDKTRNNDQLILNSEQESIEKIVKLSNENVEIEATNIGAKIKHIYIKYFETSAKNEVKVDLIDQIGDKNNNLSLSMLINDQKFNFNNKTWFVEKRGKSIVFSLNPTENLTIYKKIELNDDHTGKISLEIDNRTNQSITFKDIGLSWGPGKSAEKQQFNVKKAVALVGNKVERFKPKKKFQTETVPLTNGYVGMVDQYNSALFYGENNVLSGATINQNSDKTIELIMNLGDTELDYNENKKYDFNFYFGFQNYRDLKKLNIEAHKIVDFGWFRFLSVPMYHALNYFYDLTKNYGLAIILLTILIRGILWWPTHRSQSSMKKMQSAMSKMQPRLKTLKEVYKDNPQKLNEETMKLYKEYQVNPMGGCLPMLLMMPVLFAMFSIMRSAVELKGAPFFWMWQDLSAKDPTYSLPIAMGLSMFLQQKISTPPAATPEAATQQKMMLYLMPVMLTFFSFMWPSGLLLYWVVSNVLSIGQQVLINNRKV